MSILPKSDGKIQSPWSSRARRLRGFYWRSHVEMILLSFHSLFIYDILAVLCIY